MLNPELFENLPLLADGGYPPGASPAEGPEGWCLAEDPQAMRAHQAAYRAAGARLLRTHVPRANEVLLHGTPLAGRAEAICHTAAALAREAHAGRPGGVMGCLPNVMPDGAHPRDVERAFAQQVIYLSDKEVDFFIMEHLQPGQFMPELLRICREESDAPLLAVIRPWEGMKGPALADFAAGLADAGVQALGLGCFAPTPAALEWLTPMNAPGLPLAWLPAPGTASHADFAAHLRQAGQAGALIVGGCCGVPPEALRGV